jgi:hypothetical protein
MTETDSTTIADDVVSAATTTDDGRTTATDDGRATPMEHERANRTDDRRRNTTDGLDVRTYLYRGALVVLVLLAIVALFQFYTSALNVIRTFVAPRYRSLFNAIFNLGVLLAAGIGISFVIREMD